MARIVHQTLAEIDGTHASVLGDIIRLALDQKRAVDQYGRQLNEEKQRHTREKTRLESTNTHLETTLGMAGWKNHLQKVSF